MICVDITGAQTHDSKPAEEMMNPLNLEKIDRFIADKTYDTNKIRDFLKKRYLCGDFKQKKTKETF